MTYGVAANATGWPQNISRNEADECWCFPNDTDLVTFTNSISESSTLMNTSSVDNE